MRSPFSGFDLVASCATILVDDGGITTGHIKISQGITDLVTGGRVIVSTTVIIKSPFIDSFHPLLFGRSYWFPPVLNSLLNKRKIIGSKSGGRSEGILRKLS